MRGNVDRGDGDLDKQRMLVRLTTLILCLIYIERAAGVEESAPAAGPEPLVRSLPVIVTPVEPAYSPPPPEPTRTVTLSLPKMEWSGDLRYRLNKGHEAIDEDRTYHQLRARLGLRAEVNEQVHATIRLATATSAISQNQTLGDSGDPGMPRRGFGIDLAFMDWQVFEAGNLWLGRTANPFWSPNQAQLIFDSDLAFEGLALKVYPHWGRHTAFVNAGAFIISEEYSTANANDLVDVGLVGGDLGYRFSRESMSATAHVGNYYYVNIQDKPVTSLEKSAVTDQYSYPFDSYRGNTIYPNDPLLPVDQRKYYFQHQYVLLEAGAEWKHRLGAFEYTVFVDLVRNDHLKNLNRGYEYGGVLKYGRFSIGEAWISKKRDAVVAAFTDSDSNGGGTDGLGTKLQLNVQLSKNATLTFSQYKAKRGVDTVEREYALNQLDLGVKF